MPKKINSGRKKLIKKEIAKSESSSQQNLSSIAELVSKVKEQGKSGKSKKSIKKQKPQFPEEEKPKQGPDKVDAKKVEKTSKTRPSKGHSAKQPVEKKEKSQVPQYNFEEREKKWLDFWQDSEIFRFNPKMPGKIFSIDTPPPTVSGTMHLGHSASYSQHDFIARYKRMQGFNVFFPFGFDDNGLPTEKYVEKKLNIKSREMPRQEFIKLCLKETQEVEEMMRKQWQDIAYSADFSIAYRTIDDISRTISQKSFIDLYKNNRAYRKECPVLWCPECATAIAQVELKDKEEETLFSDLIFKVDGYPEGDPTAEVIISTTRPEFLPACVAVFYNSKDLRYKHLKFKKIQVPLFNFLVPIMEDDRVDINKGSGLVMCCTFGDQTDMDWWRAYGLPYKKLISKDGKLTEIAGPFKDLTIKQAREEILKELKKKRLIKKQEKIKHSVNVHERCGTEVEFLITKQWFIKYLDLKEKFLEMGKEISWFPGYMHSRYENWILGLQWDWCISRQRFFGVPFPVWYCKKCDEVFIADEKQLPVDPFEEKPKTRECTNCGSKDFIPEKDIIDTWATSSLTPDIALATAEQIFKHPIKKVFPYSLRPQAHDIITFWAFNTIAKSYLHHDSIPWENIMISGYVLFGKEKMSKSKGNTIEPSDILNKYGIDALRYWTSTSKLGEDISLDEKDLVTAQRLIKKIWNAYQFIKIHLPEKIRQPNNLEEIDAYLLLKLEKLIHQATECFENYEYSHARALTEKFFWQTFCDNYLEIIKSRIFGQDEEKKKSAQFALNGALLTVLKLFSPIMPCITEEIYQEFFKQQECYDSIHVSKWPQPTIKKFSKDQEILEKKGDVFFSILEKVRKEKSQNQKSMKSEIILTMDKEELGLLKGMLEDLKAVTSSKEIKEGEFKVEFI